MATQTVTCTKCGQAIETADGYLVASGDDLQFTSAADPQLAGYEEAMHFACSR